MRITILGNNHTAIKVAAAQRNCMSEIPIKKLINLFAG